MKKFIIIIIAIISLSFSLYQVKHIRDNKIKRNNVETSSHIISKNEHPNQISKSSINNTQNKRIENHFNEQTIIDLSIGDFSLKGEKGSLIESKIISANTLKDIEVPPMDPGMVNVTAQSEAYRLLPHGSQFNKSLRIGIPYDTAKIPTGYKPTQIRSYFFDEKIKRWVVLPIDTVDEALCIVYSYTNHFTDFINGILKVPESPQTNAYTPTSLKEMKAANPLQGVNIISPPQANNNGTANISLPIDIPAGRNGIQPNLGLSYSSEGGNGWLGIGWNLNIPAIDVETRWGVPRYSTALETESYLLSGEQLTPMVQRESFKPRNTVPTTKQFYQRVEGSFNKIIRHGTSPKTYWWQVTDRNGVNYYYGAYSSGSGADTSLTLTDNSGNIAHWALAEVRDLHNNFVKYKYHNIFHKGVSGGTVNGKQLYPKEITYTGHGTTEGKYKIEFDINDVANPRQDIIISGRNGFKEVTAHLLRSIYVSYNNNFYRKYLLNYDEGAFNKSLLCFVVEIVDNAEFSDSILNEVNCDTIKTLKNLIQGVRVHSFDYFDEDTPGFGTPETVSTQYSSTYDILKNIVNIPFEHSLGQTFNDGWSVGGGLGVGADFNCWLKSVSLGGSYTYSENNSHSKLLFMDIDGDGLQDKVYNKLGPYYYRKLMYSGNTVTFDTNEIRIDGLPSLGKSKSISHCWGLEGHIFIANASWSKTFTNSLTSEYFADVNADGLPDFISNENVYINSLDASGNSKFTLNNSDTLFINGNSCNYILREGPVNDSVYPPLGDITDYYGRDAVRIWLAPYDGDIVINAPIQLVEDTGISRKYSKTADGIQYSIQYNGAIIKHDTINESNYNIHANDTSISVHKGDRIYFRLQSRYTRIFDVVDWKPNIYYLDQYSNPDTNRIDADGKKVKLFKTSDDLLINNKQLFQAPYQGKVRLKGSMNSTALSDTIKFSVKHNTSFIIQDTFPDNTAISYSIDTILNVVEGEEISLFAYTNTNINWNNIDYNFKISYTESDSITIDTTSEFSKIEVRPILQYNMFQKTLSASLPYSITNAGTYNFAMDTAAINGTGNGEIIFAIKANEQILGKKKIIIQNGSAVGNPDINLTFNGPKNIYFEFFAEDESLVDSMTAKVKVNNGAPQWAGLHTFMPDSMWKFGNLYRGWGQFSYKGDLYYNPTISPIDESKLCLSKLFRNPNLITFDTTNFSNAPMTKLSANGLNDPVNESFSIMCPDLDSMVWRDFAKYSYVGNEIMSNTHKKSSTDTIYDSPLITSINPALEVRTIRKEVVDTNTSWGFSAGVGVATVGNSSNSGISYGTLDYFDLNGDRYPDIVGT